MESVVSHLLRSVSRLVGFRVVEGINPNHTTTTKIKTIDIVIEAREENIIIIKINPIIY